MIFVNNFLNRCNFLKPIDILFKKLYLFFSTL
jgi:hypothetical protein